MSRQSTLIKEDVDRIINKYINGESTRKIAETETIGKSQIAIILHQNNISMKGIGNSYNLRKYNLNEHYFDTIDTLEKAYWIGLLSSDGHISSEGFSLTLNKKDLHILETFREDLESNIPLRYNENTNSYTLNIWSKYMSMKLNEYNFDNNKSYTQTFLYMDDNLINHYIRGLLDGDGSLQMKTRLRKRYKTPTTEFSVDFSGTYSTMTDLKKVIMKNCNANDVKINIGKNNVFSTIRWCGNIQVVRILNWIYKNQTRCLIRKYNIYKKMLGE